MTADMVSNKKLNPIVTEVFITDRKVDISVVHFYYTVLLFCAKIY